MIEEKVKNNYRIKIKGMGKYIYIYWHFVKYWVMFHMLV